MEQAVAAPYCTAKLADAGARVIKIEREAGDFARGYDSSTKGQSSYFVWLNRGKESLVLNIKKEEDIKLLRSIVSEADVLVQNLAPGAMKRAGFGSAEMRELNSQLITVDISGYGASGEYSKMKAYDLLVQAESALCSVTGHPAGPGRVGVSVCDISCGMAAHSAILEALIERDNTTFSGKGISVSLFDGMADWMNVPLLYYEGTGVAPKRVGLAHPSIAPYGAFATKDGALILISIQNEREWVDFCTHFLKEPNLPSKEGFRSNVERTKHRETVDEYIGKHFVRYTGEECAELLGTAKTAYGFVNDVAGLSKHPALRRVEVDTPNGPVQIAAPPAVFSDGERALGPVPSIGQHSELIRKEFGVDIAD